MSLCSRCANGQCKMHPLQDHGRREKELTKTVSECYPDDLFCSAYLVATLLLVLLVLFAMKKISPDTFIPSSSIVETLLTIACMQTTLYTDGNVGS